MYCATTFTCTGGGAVWGACTGLLGFPLPLPVLAIEVFRSSRLRIEAAS
jgi:hypothetical protein